jgi:hypothetical protein
MVKLSRMPVNFIHELLPSMDYQSEALHLPLV